MRFREEIDDELLKAAMKITGKNVQDTVVDALKLVAEQERWLQKLARSARMRKHLSKVEARR